MKCGNCGKDYEGNFCPNCGQKNTAETVTYNIQQQTPQETTQQITQQPITKKKKSGCLVPLVVFCIVVGLFYSIGSSQRSPNAMQSSKVTTQFNGTKVQLENDEWQEIQSTLTDCGIDGIQVVKRDELLDKAYTDTCIGYRIETSKYKNIIVYMDNDKVFRIYYQNVPIYKDNKVSALANNVHKFAFSIAPSDNNNTFLNGLDTLLEVKDKVEETSVFKSNLSPTYVNEMGLYPIVAKSANYYYFYLRIQYLGEKWLFINKYTLNVDGQKYTIIPDKMIRNNDSRIWEYSTVPFDIEIMFILSNIAKSEKTILRYQGQDSYFDREITSDEKQAIKEILNIYNLALLTK